jgi:hypothetical protein
MTQIAILVEPQTRLTSSILMKIDETAVVEQELSGWLLDPNENDFDQANPMGSGSLLADQTGG